jgi:oligopeptide transport system substrate-binding protein
VSVTRYRYHDYAVERFVEAFAAGCGQWCDRNGIALTGHMMEEPTLQSQTGMIGEAMQSMWATELGVTVSLVNQDWAAVLQTCIDGDYYMACNVWIADFNDPISFLDIWQTGGGNNTAQYSNTDFDAAIQAAKSTNVPADRIAAMHKAEDLLIGQDQALAPLFFYTYCYCADPHLKGVYYTPLGYFFFGYTSMD